ncbi:glycosyltransferase family 39 protein [Nocardia lijiangensis]|uniref:glycosyltransferase family 39 protein n=1 Tax=Nocardia lijiangensis TaxID=299618 RepID=UPI00082F67B4|nr:glycosyltransferase family 39 protein [Nocardia lijiangensis]
MSTATLTPPESVSLHRNSNSSKRDRWEHPALAVLLIGTGVAYLCNLGANGWANSFYSAAVQAGSQSWTAFFFGSSDAGNSITVDKPPASLWLMELSVRLFGLSSWSILVPQVLLGVGTVALLWATVRRSFGPAAGLLSGLVVAVTPVAALMFRFNNPDALLVFLMVAAAWAMLRAVADGRWRWLVLTGAFIGFGFLAKQLQVLLVVPALALTYLIAGPPALGKRIAQLCAAGVSMVAAAGWWLLAVELWPASSRPWIGGSQSNSILELTLGYNGLGRLNGNETGSVGPGAKGGRSPMWGDAGITRLFEPAQGGQIAWLIPAAAVALIAGIMLRGRAPRTDGRRAALVLWGGWLLVTGLVFSFMAGIFHQYYTVALAPAIAALVGSGMVLLWRERDRVHVRVALAIATGTTTAAAWILLSRSADFVPWLRWTILVADVAATVALLFPLGRKRSVVAALTAAFVGLAGPVAYTVHTLATPHSGPIPTAGPSVGFGFGGRPGGGGATGGGPMMPGGNGSDRPPRGAPGASDTAPAPGGTGDGAAAIPGGTTGPNGTAPAQSSPSGGTRGGPAGFAGPGGGFMSASTPGDQLVALLEDNGDAYTWVAATVSSNRAAGYQLATELPVMPIGGFNGTDPSPTLAQFQQYVADGKIHYFLGGEDSRPNGDESSESAKITAWVRANFTAMEVDGVTVYDLTTR